MDIFRLDGKRALITGGSKGIGFGIGEALAKYGAQVTLCARNEKELLQAVREINKQGGQAQAMVADVTDTATFAEQIADQGPFHVLVNNAGTNRPKPLQDLNCEDYDAVMNVNLRAPFFVTKAIARRMIESRIPGSIINVSSQMGHVGAANRTLYCASKWAIEGFTKALAIELAPHQIRVNTLCPTFIETEMTRPFLADKIFEEQVLEKIKLGRVGQVHDLVGAAIFLASDASSLMTGSALVIDGGWTAG